MSKPCLLCCKCGNKLVSVDKLAFMTEKNHLTLTPEVQIPRRYKDNNKKEIVIITDHPNTKSLLETMDLSNSEKKKGNYNPILHILKCKGCGEKMASVVQQVFGLNTDIVIGAFVCFRPEATYISGVEQMSNLLLGKKWKERVNNCSLVKKVTFDDYKDKEEQKKEVVLEKEIIETNLPSWNDLHEQLLPPLLVTKPRDYQVEMYFQALCQNSIITLPTGTGKTLISIMVLDKILELNENKLIAFIVNKIPLAFQQAEYIKRETGKSCEVLCQQTLSEEILQRLKTGKSKICCFTDGMLKSLLLNHKAFSINDFSLIIFDEIHNGTGNHVYVQLMNEINKRQTDIRILGLTASLGKSYLSICNTFNCQACFPVKYYEEFDNIRNCTEITVETISLKDEQIELLDFFKQLFVSFGSDYFSLTKGSKFNYSLLLGQLRSIEGRVNDAKYVKEMKQLLYLMETTEVIGAKHAIDLIYRLNDTNNEIVKQFFNHNFVGNNFSERYDKLLETLKERTKQDRVIIFVQTRELAKQLHKLLNGDITIRRKFNPKRIHGQNGDDGMDFVKQESILEKFREGESKLLIATSVIEEGIDIPSCSLVVLFSGNLSLRRIIQARGRARDVNSEFKVIITNEEKRFLNKTITEELEMNEVIKKITSNFSYKLDNMINMYILSKQSEREEMQRLSLLISTNEENILVISKKISIEKVQVNKEKTKLLGKGRFYNQLLLFYELMNCLPKDVYIEWLLDNQIEAENVEFENVILSFGSIQKTNENQLLFYENRKMEYSTVKFDCFGVTFDNTFTINFDMLYNKLNENFYPSILINMNNQNSFEVYFILKKLPDNSIITNNFVLKLIIKEDQIRLKLVELISILKKNSILSYFINVITTTNYYLFENLTLDFNTKYFLKCIQTEFPFIFLDKDFSELLNSFEPKKLQYLTQQLISIMNQEPLIYIMEIAQQLVKNINDVEDADYNFIKRIVIENSNTYTKLPVLCASNRVFRNFGTEHLLKVTFNQTEIENAQLDDFEYCGENFTLLGGSQSQLRTKSLYFWNVKKSKISVEKLLSTFGQYIGDDVKEINISKYISKLSLNFTSTIPTISICKEEFTIIEDETTNDGVLFSDGIGVISLQLAKQISLALNLHYTPSAFQIRCLGFKGVLSVYDPSPLPKPVTFRESMCKFNGDLNFNTIDIVTIPSTKRGAFLNAQIIFLLYALGIKDDVFIELMDNHLQLLSESFIDPIKAKILLNLECNETLPILQKLLPTQSLFNYSFINNLLKYIFQKHTSRMATKGRIYVEKSRVAMGLMDELGVLNEGEVGLYLSGDEDIKDGTEVVVCRNPCLHPGDVKVFKTKKIQNYNRTTNNDNIIFFPSKGTKSHPHELGGGDLDGDRYFICWESKLIPTLQFDTFNYSCSTNTNNSNTTAVSEITNYIVKQQYVTILNSSSTLGRISNAWVAIVDEEGAFCPNALKLAELFSTAVDSPKTGNQVNLPVFMKDISYPNYLKSNGYESKSIIGKIYNKCKNISLLDDLVSLHEDSFEMKDEDENNEIYNTFKLEMAYLIKSLNLQSEFDLIAGEKEHKDLFILLSKKYSKIFHFNNESKYSIKRWYELSNIENNYFNSFSWIIDSEMLKYIENEQQNIEDNNYEKKIFKSLESFFKNNSLTLDELEECHNIKRELELISSNARFSLHGSVPFLLFDKNNASISDLDICLIDLKKNIDLNNLQKKIENHFEWKDFHYVKEIPLLRCQGEATEYIKYIDITKSITGLTKKILLRKYLTQQPKLIYLLFFLIQWVHTSLESIKTHYFVWYFIEYCIEMDYLKEEEAPSLKETISEENSIDDIKFIKQIMTVLHNINYQTLECKVEIDLLLSFFKSHISTRTITMKDILDPTIIYPVANSTFSDSCFMAYFALIYSKNVNFVLDSFSTVKTVEIRLIKHFKKILGNGTDKNFIHRMESDLLVKTKCTALQFIFDSPNIIIKAEGNRQSISYLKTILNEWRNILSITARGDYHNFMEGSTLLLFENVRPFEERYINIEFITYTGPCQVRHKPSPIEKHIPIITTTNDQSSNYFNLEPFRRKLGTQLEKAKKYISKEYLSSDTKFKISVKFGFYYMMHAIKRLAERALNLTVEDIQLLMDERKSRKLKGLIKSKEEEVNAEALEDDEIDILTMFPPSNEKEIRKGNNNNNTAEKKTKKQLIPSDTFYTIIPENKYHLCLQELEKLSKNNYKPFEYFTINALKNKEEIQFKLNDEYILINKEITSRPIRWLATSFIGKKHQMRFYFNSKERIEKKSKFANLLRDQSWHLRKDNTNNNIFITNPVCNIQYARQITGKCFIIPLNSMMNIKVKICLAKNYWRKESYKNELIFDSEQYELKLGLDKSVNIMNENFEDWCEQIVRFGLQFLEMLQQ
ncbi:hypothetical protein ABK040_002521 [Willaertia magna]